MRTVVPRFELLENIFWEKKAVEVPLVVVELVTIIPIDEFGEIKPSEVVAHLELGVEALPT